MTEVAMATGIALSRLSKHEASGNDFLVAVGPVALTPSAVRALCNRRRGVGADGVIVVEAPGAGADLSMRLYNADGTEAEMSGNGIRCLAQAAVGAGLTAPGRFTVSTPAGVRTVDYRVGEGGGEAAASVDMGPVRLGPEVESPLEGTRARVAHVGNPHVVVLCDAGLDLESIDLAAVAARASANFAQGVNVEVVRAGPDAGTLSLRVFERGVGETLACGTGSCAAAAVAAGWGVVSGRVRVVNPGGALEVVLGDPVLLAGPVRHVADVTVDPAAIAS